MLAVKFYEETADELNHYYVIYKFSPKSIYPIMQSIYVSEWSKDLTLDELRKVTGNDQISGIIPTEVSTFYMQQYEYRMMKNLDYFRFLDKEFKKGKSIEQIDADWKKQQKIASIKEAAKEYK